tara:strand:- start:7 stop:516 length:510 start_codon:yes stop_codon:yes gene_type:complete
MSTFKAGDNVKAISKSFGWGFVKEGDLGVVKLFNGSQISVDFPNQHGWKCFAKDLELVGHFECEITVLAPKWSIYNNDLPWEKLSNKQKGKLLLAAHAKMKFTCNNLDIYGDVCFNYNYAVYKAIKPEPVKPEPTMAELFDADADSFDFRRSLEFPEFMIAKGWNKPCK